MIIFLFILFNTSILQEFSSKTYLLSLILKLILSDVGFTKKVHTIKFIKTILN